MDYHYLILGFGLFGLIFKHAMTKKWKYLFGNWKNHVVGNVCTELDENINVHKYDDYIFITDNEEIWEFINFADFNRYTNSLLLIMTENYTIYHFNMVHFIKCWVLKHLKKLKQKLINEKQS